MTTFHAVVWMDHTEAHVLMFDKEHVETQRIKARSHHTPKHGSWLNIAECELSALTRQSLNGRIPDRKTLQKKLRAWTRERNAKQRGVNWRFTTSDARIKLKQLYPQIQM
mgnify:CR=1 FL=1